MLQVFKFLKFVLPIFFAIFSIGCEGSETAVFWEYCIPLEFETNSGTDRTDLNPPTVGVVLSYEDYDTAPAADSSAVEHFLISTETPITTIQDSSLASFQSLFENISIAVVDSISAGDTQPVSARMAVKSHEILKVKEPTDFIPSFQEQKKFDGILGGDILRKFVVRLYFGSDPQCTFAWDQTDTKWPNVLFLEKSPSTVSEMSKDGYAVVDFELSGGGKFMTLNDDSVDFPASRIPVQICVEPDPFPPDPENPDVPPETNNGTYPVSGVDMYALVATGTKPLLTTENGMERIMGRLQREGVDSSITYSEIHLGEGSVSASILSGIRRIALVGGVNSTMSACAELARRRGKEWGKRHPGSRNPFYKDAEYSGAAVVEIDLSKSGKDFSITGISSETSYWQGLWLETMPDIPQIDFILGFDFLKYFEMYIDYPYSKLSLRCLNYDCSTNSTCCNRLTGACECSADSVCCQYNLINQ